MGVSKAISWTETVKQKCQDRKMQRVYKEKCFYSSMH